MLGSIKYRAIAPDEDCLDRGAKFFCQIDRPEARHNGVVLDEQGAIRWRYGMRKSGLGRSWRNPFNKQDFVVTNHRTGEEVVVGRLSFLPPRFTITDAQGTIGTVCMASVLRNRYTINVNGAQRRVFRMPLFTLRFWGGSDESADFWVFVGPSKMEWNILIRPGTQEQPLVAALSFIHTEWWNYG